jgi:N-acetylglucosaminyldiphosphoundecaprenol N-acetyl-beta-D-mannosaminyltransferase
VQEVVCRYRRHAGNMSRFSVRAMHEEALWLIDRWADDLTPAVTARRRAVHQTLVAFEDLKRLEALPRGLWRLVTQGSPAFLLSRPFIRAFRAVRRRVRRPFWRREGGSSIAAVPLRVDILGVRVTPSSFVAAQEAVAALVEARSGCYVSPANAYSLSLARADPRHRANVNGASHVTPDGMSVVWALRWLGHRTERVHNDDLCLACCDRFRTWRHFLVGGRRGQPEVVAAELARRFPGISVVGVQATPVRPVPEAETEAILARIRSSGADIVWVGMGTPAQDEWMATSAPRAGLPMVGVGSLFDLLAGHTLPAPGWVKRGGLQWLFRLAQEPRRLAFRYLYHNARFVLAFSAQLALRALHRT